MLAVLFAAFLLLLLIGFDVGFSMVLAAWVGIITKPDRLVDAVMMPLTMTSGVDAYVLVQVPLFILAGDLMNRGGLTLRLIEWAMTLVGRIKGSLGHVSIISLFVLSGVSGSAVADAVAIGGPVIPAMRKAGYHEGYAGAVVQRAPSSARSSRHRSRWSFTRKSPANRSSSFTWRALFQAFFWLPDIS